MTGKKWMAIIWPAFMVAGLIEMLVFALVDPHDLRWGGLLIPISRQGIQTLAFFLFWALALLSSALTMLLAQSPEAINQAATRTPSD